MLTHARPGDRNFKENCKDVAQLRRAIAGLVAEIWSIGNAAFGESELLGEFRPEISKTRAKMAFHHACCPIIAIDVKIRTTSPPPVRCEKATA